MFELTKPLPPQTPYAQPNTDHGMMNQHFGGYARPLTRCSRPKKNIKLSVEHWLAIVSSLQSRRSMELPAMRTEPQITREPNKKRVKNLFPMFAVANEIDKLDSEIGGVSYKAEDQTEYGRQHRTTPAILKVLAENSINSDPTRNMTRKKPLDGIDLPESRGPVSASESDMKPLSPVQSVKDNRNHMRKSSRMGLDKSSTPALSSAALNPVMKSSSESSENFSDLIPTQRVFRTVSLAEKPVNEEANTSLKLVN